MKNNVKTKIIIGVVFAVILALLIAAFFLTRRGDGEVRSAYDYSKTTVTTQTTTQKNTLKASSNKVVVPAAYVNILNRYQDALKAKSDLNTLRRSGLSTLLTEMYEDEPQENVGFFIDDFNGDGTTDLLIGVIDGYDHFPYAVLDYYTLDNYGKAYSVFRSVDGDYYTVCTKARVLEKVKDDFGFTAWYLYGFNSNGMQLQFKEGLLRDKVTDPKNPWYKTKDMDGNSSNDESISTKAGETRQTQFDNARVQVDFVPFSQYDRSNKAK